ncbi:MAG TPA: exo-alpha-sialidase [Chitinophagaceae bacterium]|nr:exo-alpha-sialidase [Chitinophagaceae bacterium]
MVRLRSGLLFTGLFVLGGFIAFGQAPCIASTYRDADSLTRLSPERVMIYVPDTSWLYNHHPSITHYRGRIWAIWSDGLRDEDQPGQRILVCESSDFFHWGKPAVLATPSRYRRDTFNILTAAGFHQYRDTLVAYFGEYSPHRTQTRLWAKYTCDGKKWSRAIDLGLAVIPNHGPQRTLGGSLLISGNVTFPRTHDSTGLRGWQVTSFYPDSLVAQDNPATFYAPAEKMGLPPLCEGSFYQTGNGTLHMLLRVTGKGWKGRLWLTESRDDGQHWSFPIETQFPDNDSKFHFGQLPDGRYYYVGIPDTLHHYDRTPLVLSVSGDGCHFDKHYILADQPYTLKRTGLWKGGQYGYPHTMIWQGFLYVIVSRQKEAIEILRFRLSQI